MARKPFWQNTPIQIGVRKNDRKEIRCIVPQYHASKQKVRSARKHRVKTTTSE